MLNKLIVIPLFCLPFSVCSADFEFSLGAGFQYSGILGSQFALKQDDSKYFVSVGAIGYSVGMQTLVSENDHHSAGFSVGKLGAIFGGDHQYGFLTYNYHPDGFSHSGWVLGTGVGVMKEESHTVLFTKELVNPSAKAAITLDIGYKF